MNFLTPNIASTSGLLLMFNSIGFVPLWSHCSGYKRHRITANNDITTNRQYCSRKQSFVVTPVGVEGLATLSEAPSQNMATFFDVWTVRLDKSSRQFLLKLKTLHSRADILLMLADNNSVSPLSSSKTSMSPLSSQNLQPPPHLRMLMILLKIIVLTQRHLSAQTATTRMRICKMTGCNLDALQRTALDSMTSYLPWRRRNLTCQLVVTATRQ